MNPYNFQMKPDIFKTVILLFLLFFSFGFARGEKLADFPDLVNPTQILVNRDYIYLMEPPRILIYGKSDLKLIKSFDRAGEGPGEFKIPLNTNPQQFFVDIQAGNLLVSQQGRISLLTAMGEPIRDMPLSEGNRFRMVGDGFLGFGVAAEGKIRLSTLNVYDGNLKKIRELYRKKSWIQEGEGWNMLRGSYPHVVILANRIFSIGLDSDFRIEVYDFQGELKQTIKRSYRPVPFTEKDKQRVLEKFRTGPTTAPEFEEWKRILRFPEFFPSLRNLFSDGSRLLVRTFASKNGKSEFLVFRPDGTFVKTLWLLIRVSSERWSNPFLWDSAPFAFFDGVLYQLFEDEENETYQLERLPLPL